MNRKHWSALVLIILMIPLLAYARKFANQFIEFDLPPRWDCALEGQEWICQSDDEKKRHEAIIVMAAKFKGRQDSLDQYNAYLKGSKVFSLPGGKTVKSKPKYTKYTKIRGHMWVDSLHLASEIPGFYTRYVATIKEDIAVLLTYSVAKHKYKDYEPVFSALVDSLTVFRKAGGIDAAQSKKDIFKRPKKYIRPGLGLAPQPVGGPGGEGEKVETEGDLAFYLLILVAVVGFVIWKKRKGA